jgi:hypothetical protein
MGVSAMPSPENPSSNRSVTIGGSAQGNIIQTGDHNIAALHYEQVQLPPPQKVDVQTELAALRELLARIETPDRKKIDHALEEAQDESKKPNPNKDEVGKALDRALDYAKKAEGFAKVIETLKPHIASLASWLGSQWHHLLAVVGLVVR